MNNQQLPSGITPFHPNQQQQSMYHQYPNSMPQHNQLQPTGPMQHPYLQHQQPNTNQPRANIQQPYQQPFQHPYQAPQKHAYYGPNPYQAHNPYQGPIQHSPYQLPGIQHPYQQTPYPYQPNLDQEPHQKIPMTYNPHRKIRFPRQNRFQNDDDEDEDEDQNYEDQEYRLNYNRKRNRSNRSNRSGRSQGRLQQWTEKIPYSRKKTVVKWINRYQQAPVDEYSDDEVHIQHSVEFVQDHLNQRGFVPIQSTQVVRPEYQYPPGYYEYDDGDRSDNDEDDD